MGGTGANPHYYNVKTYSDGVEDFFLKGLVYLLSPPNNQMQSTHIKPGSKTSLQPKVGLFVHN